MLKYIIIHPADNVAVALQPLEEGESITYGSTIVKVREQVPAGHKVSLVHIFAGQDVIKYGSPIGHATEARPSLPFHGFAARRPFILRTTGFLVFSVQDMPGAKPIGTS